MQCIQCDTDVNCPVHGYNGIQEIDMTEEVNEAQSAMELIDNPPPPEAMELLNELAATTPEPEPEKFDLFKVLPNPTKAPGISSSTIYPTLQTIQRVHGIHIVKRMWDGFMIVKIQFLSADGEVISTTEAHTNEEVIDEANGKFFTVGEPEDHRTKCSHCG